MRSTSYSLSSLLALTYCPSFVLTSCECGYGVNSTTEPMSAVFTDVFETDFLHFTDDDWLKDNGWRRQDYDVSPSLSRGPYGKQASLDNVIANPFDDSKSWTGPGTRGSDAGLQLYVRPTGNTYIGMAEIASERTDMLYGSFRIAMKVTGVPGTCGAFFWYHDNTQEIDLEFLSDEYNATTPTHPLNLVVQTPQSTKQGFNAAGTSDYRIQPLPFPPQNKYHEYRFDWTPNLVTFWVDGHFMWSMSQQIPTSPGHLVINHWSNGDPHWSGGPPAEDAIITVAYVKAYFNSSNPKRGAAHSKICPTFDAGKVCQIPDVTAPLDPDNMRSRFFTQSPDDAPGQIVYNATRPHSSGVGARASWSGALRWMVIFAIIFAGGSLDWMALPVVE